MTFNKLILCLLILLSACGKNIDTASKLQSSQDPSSKEQDQSLEGQLKLALEEKKLDLVRIALRAGAQASMVSLGAESPVTYAIKEELTEMLSLLLEYNPPLNKPNKKGEYPIHVAIDSHNYDAIKLLLKSGTIDFSIRNERDQTPIWNAFYQKDVKVLMVSISQGMPFGERSQHGEYLDEAAQAVFGVEVATLIQDLRVIKESKQRYARLLDVIQNDRMRTTTYSGILHEELQLSLDSSLLIYVLNNKKEELKLHYLRYLLNVFNFDQLSITEALFASAEQSDLESFILIHESFPYFDLNTLKDDHLSLLSVTAANLDYQFSKYLRSNGADTRVQNQAGKVVNACHALPSKNRSNKRRLRFISQFLGC